MRRVAWLGGWTAAACLLGAPVVAANDGSAAAPAPPAAVEPPAAEEPQRLLEAGLGASRAGRPREALRALASVVRRHGGTRWAGEAWLALGEHHLGARDLTRARAAFETARRSPDPAVSEAASARLERVEAVVRDETSSLARSRR